MTVQTHPNLQGRLKSILANRLFSSGMISLIIKVAGAGLSYFMFVAFAHLLSAEDYGVFAFSFNLAIVVAAVAGFGYSTAVMRYWPKYLAQDKPAYAKGAIKMGMQLTLVGVSVILLIGLLADHFSSRNLLSIAALAATFCMGDFASGVLRAQHSVVGSMLPRDVLWRILAPMAALAGIWFGYHLTSSVAVYICAFVLLVLLLGQIFLITQATRDRKSVV